MKNDPVIEEVRAAREELLREAGGDARKMAHAAMDVARSRGVKFVTPEELRKRREAAENVGADQMKA